MCQRRRYHGLCKWFRKHLEYRRSIPALSPRVHCWNRALFPISARLPAEVDWSRYNILVIRCDVTNIGVDSCARWNNRLSVGGRITDKRCQSGPTCSSIELPSVTYIGYISYSLYMVQGIVFVILVLPLHLSPDSILYSILFVGFCFGAAAIISPTLEYPARNWLRRFSLRKIVGNAG